MKKWYVYSFFEKINSENFKNIEIYQSIDFLSEEDSKRSMSWRNGTP